MSLIGGLFRVQTATYIAPKRRLAGSTQVDGVGSPKRVFIIHSDTLACMTSTKSNTNGTWEIKGLPETPAEKLICLIIDDTRSFDPIAFDNITLVE